MFTFAGIRTGIFGRGDNHGVYGVSGSVDVPDTPSFRLAEVQEALGVVGVSGSSDRGDAPAIFGDKSILQKDLNAPFPDTVRETVLEALQFAVGVEGISWSGIGVYGISLNLDPGKGTGLSEVAGIADTAAGRISDAIEPDMANPTAAAGVIGLSRHGAGVRGASRFDRGRIFQSVTARQEPLPSFPGGGVAVPKEPVVAQIRLVPHRVYERDQRTGNPHLPRDGQTGDLL